MDQAEKTMLENLERKSGKSLDEWISVVEAKQLNTHSGILKFLKSEHGFTHGFANLVALKTLKSDSGSAENPESLIDKQNQGKEHFRPVYEKLIGLVQSFGEDVEISPKNAYVSLRRKKQFAILQPASKTRFEIGLNLKGQATSGILEEINKTGSMCSHKINIGSADEISSELIGWLKQAYTTSN